MGETGATHPSSSTVSKPRPVIAIYTNVQPAMVSKAKNVAGPFVILECQHYADLSLRSTDSDKVSIRQDKSVRAEDGKIYPASAEVQNNASGRGNSTVVRGLDGWEQAHWWWGDARATMLEYSIFLPKSFLQPGGENKDYPLVLAITHSGTSYDGATT